MKPDIRKPLKKLLPVMLKAQEENLNEADTVQRLVMFFEQVLGYDPLTEITHEKQIKDKYVDIAIKIDANIKLLVEAKAAATDLRDRHIEQAKSYAAEGNIRWVVLTNGVIWSLYHLTFDEGLEYERVFQVDLKAEDIDEQAKLLALLHRRSIKSGEHEEFWNMRSALGPSSLARALYTDTVLRVIRRDIRKRDGVLVDEEDLAAAFHSMFTAEVREKIGPVRIRRKRASPKEGRPSEATAAQPAPSTTGPPEKPAAETLGPEPTPPKLTDKP